MVGHHGIGAARFGRTEIPLNRQRITGLKRRPCVFAKGHHACLVGQNLCGDKTTDVFGTTIVKRYNRAAKFRAAHDRGINHAGQIDIHGKHRGAIGFAGIVLAVQFFAANQFELIGGFDRWLFDRFKRCGDGNKFTEMRRIATRCQYAVFNRNAAGVDTPFLGGGPDQEITRCCTGFAVLHERVGD